jgi:hypothetical protein
MPKKIFHIFVMILLDYAGLDLSLSASIHINIDFSCINLLKFYLKFS